MFSRHSATLTALLLVGAASLAHAQQSTPADSTRRERDLAQDARVVTRDTTRLHELKTKLDSARAQLDSDHVATHAITTQIDSAKAQLARDRQATPRNETAIKQDEQRLATLRKQLDRSLDQEHRQRAQVATLEQRVDRVQRSTIGARRDEKSDHSSSASSSARPGAAKTSSVRTSAPAPHR